MSWLSKYRVYREGVCLHFRSTLREGFPVRFINPLTPTPSRPSTHPPFPSPLSHPLQQKAGNFQEKVFWGCDLASEHERYITEKVFKKPVILINYPKEIKAFYMKLNPDGRTVAAMDVLVPKIGEIIGGSQREDDFGA